MKPDHGNLTIEDRILLTTAKHEELEATRRTLSQAGMSEASAGGRERVARNWDIDAERTTQRRKARQRSRSSRKAAKGR